jgi:aldose 1-epimerase
LHHCTHDGKYRLMHTAEPTVVLTSSNVTVTVIATAGGRIGQIDVAGQPLLVDVPPSAGRHPTMWGMFPMAPWVGRIRNGRFSFEGVERQLPINHHDGDGDNRPERSHAIHGLVADRPWHRGDVSTSSWTSSIALDWEFGGTASHAVAVFDRQVVVTLGLESTGAAFPAEVGWHPWFRKPASVDCSPTAMYERDDDGLPTSTIIELNAELPAGPWDDCFINTEPVVLRYDRTQAPTVTVSSDCDHWVVYDHPADATCIEPQSGPPDAFNLRPHVVTPDSGIVRTMTISW